MKPNSFLGVCLAASTGLQQVYFNFLRRFLCILKIVISFFVHDFFPLMSNSSHSPINTYFSYFYPVIS